ncbi:hypothetical protein GE09DRAFT_1288834 [Coniochaeta sp. 2T2.1]|nr:hypothetical protein GE09DRAFT_1288834 [Coniochaeta sp. 2T2.1]
MSPERERVFTYNDTPGWCINAGAFVCMIAAGTLLLSLNIIFGRFVTLFTDYLVGKYTADMFRDKVNEYTLWFLWLFIAKFRLLLRLDGPHLRQRHPHDEKPAPLLPRAHDTSSCPNAKVGLDWLFSGKVPFTQWLEDRRRHFGPVFWITGKAGSGKSTAMRFAMQDPRLATALPDSKSVPYFFHLRGKSLAQKSFKGMFVELLFQLLADKPRLFLDSRIGTLYRRLLRSHRMRKLEWDVDTLEEAILSALSPPASQLSRTPIRYIFFIDALDENANRAEHKMMLSFIRHLAIIADNLPHYPDDMIKVCLASRPWPVFQNEFGHNPRIPSFAIHEFTSGDIQSYTNQHLLESARRTSSLANYQRSMGDLAVEVCKKAHGVFVWVRLVVEELCRNLQDGSTMAMLEDVLSRLPEELQDLYEYTMTRIPAEYDLETLIACQILMSSLTPLTLEALHCATLVVMSGYYQATDADTRAAWLTSRTGGLIEEVEVTGRGSTATDATVDGDHIVQLIHQTAEEFVRKGIPGLSTLSSQDFVEDEGSIFIFRAIAAQHPPFSPLRNLARQFLHHLRTIDEILDGEEYPGHLPRLTLGGIMPKRYANSMFADLYSGRMSIPLDRPTTTDVIDALADHYIHPADEEILRFLEQLTSISYLVR